MSDEELTASRQANSPPAPCGVARSRTQLHPRPHALPTLCPLRRASAFASTMATNKCHQASSVRRARYGVTCPCLQSGVSTFFHPVWRLQQFFESPGSACIRLDQHRCPAAGAGAERNPLGWFNQSGRASSTWGMRWGKEPINHGYTGSDTPVTP
jgi:hypothetical protein